MKNILTIGSCRSQPEYKRIYNIGGYFCNQKNLENYNFWCRPYGQNCSLVDILCLIKNNLKKETFSKTEGISSYVWNWKDYNIDKTLKRQFNPIEFYDGYVIEICSLKYVKQNNFNIAYSGRYSRDNKDAIVINDYSKPIKYFEDLFDEIINLLGNKPIIFLSPISINAETRYFLSYLCSKFCSKYNNTFFLDSNFIIYKKGIVSSYKKSELPDYNPNFMKSKQDNKIYLKLSSSTKGKLCHNTQLFKEELYNYYVNFFNIFFL